MIDYKKLTPQQKRRVLAGLTEALVNGGFDITWIFGKTLSYFDYEKTIIRIHEVEKENGKDEEDLFELH